MSKPLKILIDADMIVFKATSTVETPINWYGDLWTLHADAAESKVIVDEMVLSLVDKVLNHYKHEGEYEIVMCFSDKENFRKKLYPLYKANRSGKRKPSGYYGVMKWVESKYTCVVMPTLEADDVVGILATRHPNSITISGDKDFKTIPGRFYNFITGDFHEISEEEANYWHLYQTLIGDTADNYPGCPGVGSVTAVRLLEESPTWETVVKAFERKKLTEDDALLMARVARILRNDEIKNGVPILWSPTT